MKVNQDKIFCDISKVEDTQDGGSIKFNNFSV